MVRSFDAESDMKRVAASILASIFSSIPLSWERDKWVRVLDWVFSSKFPNIHGPQRIFEAIQLERISLGGRNWNELSEDQKSEYVFLYTCAVYLHLSLTKG